MRFPGIPLLVSLLLLTACGGGGGGGSDGTPTPPPEPPEPTPPPAPTTFTVSGTITASVSQAVDGDTNDENREAVSNDLVETAQPVPNPVTLGGYINQPGTGETGRSFTSGDVDDYFLVDLLAGQRVTMIVADFQTADADLYLYDTDGEMLDASADTGEIESLLIDEDGTYVVNAFAYAGATNYTLAVGSPATLTQSLPARADIVPWQAVVTLKTSDEIEAATVTGELNHSMAMDQRAGGNGRARLMVLRSEFSAQQQRANNLGPAARKAKRITNSELRARWETMHAIKSLRQDSRVAHAGPNYRIRAYATPNDDAYPLQWHYPLIGLPQAWDSTTGNPDVVVAVIDTGVLPGHPDLLGQFTEGYDFVSDTDNSGDFNGIDPIPTDPGSDLGSSFHGTHVSGTVAARGHNDRGVAGVAYDSKIMPLRALGVDGGTSYDLIQAMRYAAGLPNDSGQVPSEAADVINLSLGGSGFDEDTQILINQILDLGIVIVAAAGNEASIQPSYPAAYSGVISVSAVDAQRRIAPYSNTGTTIDVAAPGGDNSVDVTGDGYPDGVLSTGGNDSGSGPTSFVYSFLNGTSMATPHVAGVIALMKSINPDLTPGDIETLLSTGKMTDDLGAPGRDDQFGHGLINAQLAIAAALQSIGSSPADNPRLVSSATTLNFGASTTDFELSLSNGGNGDLTLTSIESSETWLTVSPAEVSAEGLGSYNIKVNRDDLNGGVYSADIIAQSSINTLTVRVFMSVGGEGFASDVGILYILLYDPVADVPVMQVFTGGVHGVYTFLFEDVAPGEYEIIAGSDADNDFFICDAGESCGAYLTTDQPVRLKVDADRSGLDFPAEFVVSLPTVQSTTAGGFAETGGKRRQKKDKKLPSK